MATIFEQLENRPKGAGALNAGIAAGDLSFVLGAGEGADYPATAGGAFRVTLFDSTDPDVNEIVVVTGRATDTFTVTRGSEATTARAWAAGTTVQLLPTGRTFTQIHEAINALETLLASGTAAHQTLRWDGDSWAATGRFQVTTNQVTVYEDGASATLGLESYYDGVEHGVFQGRASRGTDASQVILNAGDGMLEVTGRGYDSTGFMSAAQMVLAVDTGATPAAGNLPGMIDFKVQASGGAGSPSLAARVRSTKAFEFYGDLVAGSGLTTANVLNTVVTTANVLGAATSITFGATTGTLTLRNATVAHSGAVTVALDTTLTGDLAVNGGDFSSTASTFNLLNATVTTANVLGAATSITFGATTGTLTLRNATVAHSGAVTVATTLTSGGATCTSSSGAGVTSVRTGSATNSLVTAGVIRLTSSVNISDGFGPCWNFQYSDDTSGTLQVGMVGFVRDGADNQTKCVIQTDVAGTLTTEFALSSTACVITPDTTITGDLGVNGGDFTSTASTFNLLNATVTTANVLGAGTSITLGASGSGTLTLRNLLVNALNALAVGGNLSVGGNLGHTGSNVGFYNTAAAAKQEVTGSRGGNAALESLLTALATIGLVTNSSSA